MGSHSWGLAAGRYQNGITSTKKRIAKAAETEKQAVLKSIAALGEQLKAATPLIATLMAARAYTKRVDTGLNVLADARPFGHIECSFPNGETTIVEQRKHALLLCEAWTKNYIDKVGNGINADDLPEDTNIGQRTGFDTGAPGQFEGGRVLGDNGPRVVADQEDEDD